MRTKSLPLSVRSAPIPKPRTAPPPPDGGDRGRRRRDVLATIPMVLLIPLLIFPLLHVSAGGPSISVSGALVPGGEVTVRGDRFSGTQRVQIAWNRNKGGMPTAAVSGGRFSVKVRVPVTARPGRHTISAIALASRTRGSWTTAGGVTVALAVSVQSPTTARTASPTPSATLRVPSVGASSTPQPTATLPAASATRTGSPTATAVPTQAATPVPVAAPPATQAPATAAPAPAPIVAGAIYVSPGGNDSNPGTIDRPKRTLTHALSVLKPGMTLYVRGGTYAERIQNPKLTPGLPNGRITVSNYPGEWPLIQGLLWLKGASYWTFTGINVTWGGGSSSEHMVKMTDGVGWVYSNSEIWGARSYASFMVAGTAANQPADWHVLNNCIHDTIPSNGTNQDHNMYVNTGLSAGVGVIAGNVLFNATNGENIKLGGSGSGSGEGSANVVVRSNTMYNAAQPILLAGGTHHVTIENNVIVRGLKGYLIRGYQLSGAGNVARNNIGYDAQKLISNDSGYTGVADGGGNRFPLNPALGGSGCGLVPTNPAAAGYGR